MSYHIYGTFYPAYTPTAVRVSKVEGRPKDIMIDFDLVPGASSYRVYGSLSPTVRTLIGEYTERPPYFVKFPSSKVILPEELIVHIWVSAIRDNQEVFIQQEPATYFTARDRHLEMFNYYSSIPPIVPPAQASAPDYVKATIPYEMFVFYRDEIRRRHVAMMEIGGEEFLLYKRRREGMTCPECTEPKVTGNVTMIGPGRPIPFDPTVKTDQESPRFSGKGRCEVCFGTGIVGGYYYPIKIKISYWGMPRTKIDITDKGLELQKSPDAWTLWTPIIMQHDVLYRIVSGETFVVKETKISTWQGVILRQAMSFEALEADDIRVRLTREKVIESLRKYNLLNQEEEVPLWI